jgi:Cyclic nucleotide-binding domain/Acetyltransferase (GNAT) family
MRKGTPRRPVAEKPIGFGQWHVRDEAHLAADISGFIAAPTRGRGLGPRGLAEYLIERRGFYRVMATPEANNPGAIRACEKAGFRLFPSPQLRPQYTALAPTTLESLAMRLQPLAVQAGTEVVREGESGDAFYLIGSGEVDVVHGGKLVATLGTGQYFGEIALLHDVPRVATCVARGDAALYELERQVFVSAVSGNVQSHATIEDVVAGRLDELETIRAGEEESLPL